MGGLTISGFTLTPRKSILVGLAGPLIGIPVALAVMVVRPWLPSIDLLQAAANDLVFVNLWWGILNLLPIAGLDGGGVLTNLFLIAMGPRGRRPGLIVVAACSVVIAVAGLFIGFVYLSIVIAFFGILNPEPFLTLWGVVSGGPRRGRGAQPEQSRQRDDRRNEDRARKQGRDRPVLAVAADSRRAFGEAYSETVIDRPSGSEGRAGEGDQAAELDLDELERRPAPLLPDVTAMLARRDDPAVARRLAAETDPLAVLGIVARLVEGKRVPQMLGTLRRDDTPDRTAALLRLQVGLHSLGRFDESLAAASILGRDGGPRSALLEARSAARGGDRKRTAAALERAIALGPVPLSDAALGDIARLGPDRKVADLLARLRSMAPAG
jgi:hypothetical protein